MKKALLIGVLLIICSAGALFSVPKVSHAEMVSSFSSDITVEQNSAVDVTETIVYDFQGAERHGIYRDIPLRNSDGSMLTISNISVTDANGIPYKDSITQSGTILDIKIGDPNVLLTGVKTYRISYVVQNALVSFANYDELYWNVNGNSWNVPFQNISATVELPQNTPGTVVQTSCYRGPAGSNARCSSDFSATNLKLSESNLNVGEGVTLAVGFKKGIVLGITRMGGQINESPQSDQNSQNPPYNTGLSFLFYAISLLAILGACVYRYVTRDPISKNPVVAWYEPPAGLSPIVLGTLSDKITDYSDITAEILSLAEQGYISITRTEVDHLLVFKSTDYTFQVVKDTSDISSNIDKSVLNLIFSNPSPSTGTQVALSDLKAQRPASMAMVQTIKKQSSDFLESNGYFVKVKRGGYGVWLFIVGFIVLYGLTRLIPIVGPSITVIPFAFVIAGLIFGSKQDSYTQLGVDTKQQILGFKDFLSVTDKAQFDFANAPEKNPTTFMKYLPYAIALGVEQKWAEQFKDVTIPNPGWYHGGVNTFVAVDFVSHMSSLSNSFAATAMPASSGSGGGGFSGGGGGGGGGGGW